MTVRDEQREQRRMQIMQKALALFVKKGYSETRIGDIAKAAEMSVGLMFHYFESKEQLYTALIEFGAAGTNAPREMNFNDPLDYFRTFLNTLFGYAREQPWVFDLFVLMAQARRSDGIPARAKELAMSVSQVEQSAEIIRAGQRYGFFREGDPDALSFTFWGSVQGVMEQLAVSSGEQPLPDAQWLLDIIRGDRDAEELPKRKEEEQ